MHPAKSLKCRTRLENTYPFQILFTILFETSVEECATLHIQQRGRRGETLDKAACLSEMPALVVAHCAVANPMKEMRPFLHVTEETVGLTVPHGVEISLATLQIEPIELFPHLRADAL